MERLWERSREGRKETNREAEYRNRGRKHGKPGWEERGRPRKRKRKRSTEEATVRRRQEDEGKEEQRLSSQNPKLKRPKGSKNSGGQKAEGKHQSGVERKAQRGRKRKRKARVSREKQLQRLKPAEDERKLQTKRFVKLRVWKPKGGHHRFMKSRTKKQASLDGNVGAFLFYMEVYNRSRPLGRFLFFLCGAMGIGHLA